jgi:hypothetical protein
VLLAALSATARLKEEEPKSEKESEDRKDVKYKCWGLAGGRWRRIRFDDLTKC